ncbi:MAG: DUF5667 domain-containing protein [Terriglobales bacterium]
MTGVFTRQAAERFNDLLEADRSSTHNDLSPLLSVTRQLSRVGSMVHPDPEFAARFRTRLMAVAAVQEANSTSVAPANSNRSRGWLGHYQGLRRKEGTPRRVPRRLALLTGTLAVLLGLSSVGMASGNAKPGEALYGLKRNKETAQLALAGSDVSRGELHLQFARTRLNEAESITGMSKISSTLSDADAETRSAMHDLGTAAMNRDSTAPLDTIDRFVVSQRQNLSDWLGDLSGDKRTRAANSLTTLDQVQQRSQGLRSTLACRHGVVGQQNSDDLGPLVQACSPVAVNGAKKPAQPGEKAPINTPSAPGVNPPSASGSPSTPVTNSRQPGLLPQQPLPSGQPDGQIPDWLGGIFKPKN